MKHHPLKYNQGFNIIAGTERGQAATMVLGPGQSTGGPQNKHDSSDQWLYVISGQGRATVGDKQVDLAPTSLLLIEAGETHEIVNKSNEYPLETLNVYAPPEY